MYYMSVCMLVCARVFRYSDRTRDSIFPEFYVE